MLDAERLLRAGPDGLELSTDEELPLPEHVRDAVLLRTSGLDDDARGALTAAAAIGQRFDPHLAGAIAGLHDWPAEPLRRGIVREEAPGRLAFRHDLVREAFYGEIGWAQRPVLHRAIAEALERDGAPASAVAEHWARGREPDRARRSFLAAAEAFATVHAYRDAARATRRALELWPEAAEEPERLDALARSGALCRAGRRPRRRGARLARGGRRPARPRRRRSPRRGAARAGPRPRAPGAMGGGAHRPRAGGPRVRGRRPAGRRGGRTARGGGASALGGELSRGAHAARDRSDRGRRGRAPGPRGARPRPRRERPRAHGGGRCRGGRVCARRSRSPWSTTSAARPPRSTSGSPTRWSTSATTAARATPTTRRSATAPPTRSSPPPSCAWPA